MFFWLGLFGSVVMAVLEAFGATNIGYLWALVPSGVGALTQIGLLGLLLEILSCFGD